MPQLLSNLPIGALLKFGKHQVGSETAQPIKWLIAGKNHKGYPSNSVTLITQQIIDLRAYDAQETKADGTIVLGNINYSLSNIHQWLNSNASANSWYKASHSIDTAPSNGNVMYGTGYNTRAGFLYNFTTDERNALLPTTITVQTNDTITSTTAKIFLPSVWEVGGTNSISDSSSKFEYFKSMSKTCGVTSQAFTNTSSSNKPSSASEHWQYMTRSTNNKGVMRILANGSSEHDYPYRGDYGLRPVINLSESTKISDTVDSDGCYTILTQTPPIISGSDSNLGVKGNYYTETSGFPTTIGFKQTYTVNDVDASDSVTVTEYIDNVQIRSYVATKNATNTFDVTGKTWLNLSNGTHTLKITATDGFDTATRIFTFTKSVELLVAQRTSPIEASTMPTHIIATVVKSIPDGATIKVEVCNNGFDTKPIWEEVVPGEIYEFKNKAKTAGKWGVNIRVTVKRNGAEGACFITEIGGNFK